MITAVLMPITSPRDDTSGPPELPGLSAASVWITSSIMRPVVARSERPSAEITPAVTVEFEAERIADRDREVAALQGLGIAERREREAAGGVGAQQREVGVGIDAEQARLGGAPFGVGQADLARAVDDMGVGQRQPVGRDDDAGAGAAARLAVDALAGVDAHHRRADGLDHRGDRLRIGVEQHALVGALAGAARRGTAARRGGRGRADRRGGCRAWDSHKWLLGVVRYVVPRCPV